MASGHSAKYLHVSYTSPILEWRGRTRFAKKIQTQARCIYLSMPRQLAVVDMWCAWVSRTSHLDQSGAMLSIAKTPRGKPSTAEGEPKVLFPIAASMTCRGARTVRPAFFRWLLAPKRQLRRDDREDDAALQEQFHRSAPARASKARMRRRRR